MHQNSHNSRPLKAIRTNLYGYLIVALCIAFQPLFLASNSKLIDSEIPKTIIGTSDIWCPYTCKKNSDFHGPLYDKVKAIISNGGHEFVFHHTSWQRASELVKSGDAHILLGINRDYAQKEGLDILDAYEVPVNSVFLIRNSHKELFKTDTLDQLRVGFMKYYRYDSTGQWEKKLIDLVNSVAVDTHLGEDHLLTLLNRNRIDVALVNEHVANRFLADADKASQYTVLDKGVSIPIYLAFSKNTLGQSIKADFKKHYREMYPQ